MAFVEPRLLKISAKSLTESRTGLLSATAFYLVLALLLKFTVMRPTITKENLELVRREVELRANSNGSDGQGEKSDMSK